MPTFDDLLAEEFSVPAAPKKVAPTFDDLLTEEFSAPPTPAQGPIQSTLGPAESLAPLQQGSLLDARTAANAQRPTMQGLDPAQLQAATQQEMQNAPQLRIQHIRERAIFDAEQGELRGPSDLNPQEQAFYDSIRKKVNPLVALGKDEAKYSQNEADKAANSAEQDLFLQQLPTGAREAAAGALQAGVSIGSIPFAISDALGITSEQVDESGKRIGLNQSSRVNQAISQGTLNKGSNTDSGLSEKWRERIMGAAHSLGTMSLGGGMGEVGMAIGAGGTTASDAFSEGQDAGLSGKRLLAHAAAQGILEAGTEIVAQRFGMGGAESVLAHKGVKAAVSDGLMEGMKRLAKELPKKLMHGAKDVKDEILTEAFTTVAQDISSQLASGGKLGEIKDINSLLDALKETAIQTTMVVGGAHAVAKTSDIAEFFKKNAAAAKAFVERGGSRSSAKAAGFEGNSTASERAGLVERLKKEYSSLDMSGMGNVAPGDKPEVRAPYEVPSQMTPQEATAQLQPAPTEKRGLKKPNAISEPQIAPQDAKPIAQKAPIAKAEGLDDEQRAVETKVNARVEADLDGYADKYTAEHTKNGVLTINTDDARKLFPEYEGDKALHSQSVHEASSAITRHVWNRILSEPGERIAITAGGGGSGKSRAADFARDLGAKPQAVLDTTFANKKSAQERIEQAKAAGKKVDIYFTFRPADLAAASAVDRAMREGRTVPAKRLAADHFDALSNFLEMREKYKDDDSVNFAVDDNSGKQSGRPNWISIDELAKKRYKSASEVENLVQQGLLTGLKNQKSEVSESIYRGFGVKKEVAHGHGNNAGDAGRTVGIPQEDIEAGRAAGRVDQGAASEGQRSLERVGSAEVGGSGVREADARAAVAPEKRTGLRKPVAAVPAVEDKGIQEAPAKRGLKRVPGTFPADAADAKSDSKRIGFKKWAAKKEAENAKASGQTAPPEVDAARTGGRGPVAEVRSSAQAIVEKETDVGSVPVSALSLDPARFQYKQNPGKGGVTKSTFAKTFNNELAGTIDVWKDPADGKTYVVNGHHRFDLAKRDNFKGNLRVRYLNADSAEDARSLGALINVAGGNGTAVDAATYFREKGVTREDLEAQGISLTEDVAGKGAALAQLGDSLFDQVKTGKLTVERAVVIGEIIKNKDAQEKFAKFTENKRLNPDALRALAEDFEAAPTVKTTEDTLFGTDERADSIALHKAKIVAAVRDRLGKEKRLFGFAAKNAENLSDVGKIDAKAAGERGNTAEEVGSLFEKFRQNILAPMLNEAAESAHGGKSIQSAVAGIYPRIVDAVLERAQAASKSGVQVETDLLGQQKAVLTGPDGKGTQTEMFDNAQSEADAKAKKDAADHYEAGGEDLFKSDERGVTQYNLKDSSQQQTITRANIERVFPGATVKETASGHRVTFKGGNYIDVNVVDEIEVDWKSAEEDYGRKISKQERKGMVAAGSFELKSKDGKTLSGLGILQLARGSADSTTLLHESLHFAKAMGLFTSEEWNQLVRLHSNPNKSTRQQEEDIAGARESWTGAVVRKVKGWAESVLSKFGVTRGMDRDEVFELMDKAEFWSRVPVAQKAATGAPAKATIHLTFGRPDLANKGHTEPVRALQDAVDEDRKLTAETRERSVMREKAKKELAKDYEGEKNRILEIEKYGGVLNEIETHMAEEILNREASEAIKSGDPARIEEAVRVMDAYRRSGTEAARAFGARGDPMETPKQRYQRHVNEAMLTPPARMYSLKNSERTAALKEWAGKMEGLKLQLRARGVDVENINGPVDAAQALGQICAAKSDNWDALYEFWRNSILSATSTQTANIIGNVGHAAWSMTAERLVEASINLVVKDGKGATFAELPHMVAGFLPGIARGARNALLSYKAEVPMLEASMGQRGQVQVEDANVAIEGTKGRVIRFTQRMLLAADEFCKSLVAEMDVGVQAYRIAKKEKLEGAALSARMHELTQNLGSEAWRTALKTAQHLAFQDENKLAAAVVGFRKKVPGLRYLIPFVTTPMNILKTGIKKSPLGTLALGKKIHDNVKAGRPAFDNATAESAQQMIAWTVALALMASNGDDEPWITGAEADSDYRKNKLAKRTHPAQSVKIMGTWYSYSRLEPFATALAMTVDWTNGLKSKSSGKMATAPFESLMGQLKDKTFVSGLSDFLQAAFPGPGQDRAETVGKWSSNFVASWMPNLVRSGFRNTHDDVPERAVWGKGSDWWKMLGKRTLQKTELVGMVFPDEPMVDLWGNKVQRNKGPLPKTDWLYRMLVPIDKRKEEIFQGDRLLLNWNNAHPDDEKLPMVPGKNYKVDGVTKYWTPAEYAKYCELSGKLAKKIVAAEIVNADNPTAQDIATLTDALKDGRKKARASMLKGETMDVEVGAKDAVLKNEQEMLARLASPPPMKSDARAEWKEKKTEALAWVKARGVSAADARAALWKHVTKTYKDDTTRQKYMERLKLNLE